MKFTLTEEQITRLIDEATKLDLGAKVAVERLGNIMVAKISNWGTSTLKFTVLPILDPPDSNEMLIELVEQSIAFLHKKYIPAIETGLMDLVNKIKGEA